MIIVAELSRNFLDMELCRKLTAGFMNIALDRLLHEQVCESHSRDIDLDQ